VRCALGAAEKPNIVWIVAEDISPNLGCYGDPDAITPNLDKLAKEGARFTRASRTPQCARRSRSGSSPGSTRPRSAATTCGRSCVKTPPGFPDELKKAGYTVYWPGKTDFNFDVPKGLWVDRRARTGRRSEPKC